MGGAKWNDAEQAALEYLPLEARVLYLQGLRRHMDYKTGVVGISRRISRKQLQEELEVHPKAGSHRTVKPVTKDALRALFKILMHGDVGLVERVKSYDRTLVFRLPLADFDDKGDYSAPQSSARGAHEERTILSAPSTAPMSAPVNPICDAGCSELDAPSAAPMSARGAHHQSGGSSAPHPVSVIRKAEIAASVVIPPARVDRLAVGEALLKCFENSHGLMERRDVQQMVDRWIEVDVKARHVLEAVKQIREADAEFGFGPMYLEQVVFDVAAGKRVRGGHKAEDDAYHPSHLRSVDLSESEMAEAELMRWGKRNGFPFNPVGSELPTEYVFRLHRERRKMEGVQQ